MEELKEFWNFFLDWPLGTITAIFSIVIVIGSSTVVVYMVSIGILSAIDSWFMSNKNGFGEVMDKKIRPRIRELEGAIDIPAGWLIIAKVGEEEGSVSVSKELFDSLNKGDKVGLVYTYGRIYNGINIKEIKSFTI